MKQALFIDRDGTILVEPDDEQIDSFEKFQFVPGVIRNLNFIRTKLDFEFVMVSNQDGLGTSSYPEEDFWPTHNLMLNTLKGEGVTFNDILIDRSFPADNLPTRKPGTGMMKKYMSGDYDLANSYVIGDRETDKQLALNLGCKFLMITCSHGTKSRKFFLLANVQLLCDARRKRRTLTSVLIWMVQVSVISTQDWDSSTTCWSKSVSMAL